MKKRGLLSALAIGAGIMTFAGNEAFADCKKQCPKMQNCAMKATVEKLECGGSYFMVSDIDMFGKQLKNILSGYAGQLKPQEAMTMNMVVGILGQVCDYIGVSDIKSVGQSSTVLGKSADGSNFVFHNRLVITTDPAKKFPLILQLTQGENISLQQFAAAVPDNAVSAGVFSLDASKLLDALKKQTIAPIPADIFDGMKQELGMSAEELAAAVSGKIQVILWEPANAKKPMPIAAVKITDNGNKVFALICKNLGMDPATANKVVLPIPPECPVEICKNGNTLEIYIGKGTAEMLSAKLAAKQTVANDPAFKLMTQKIPAEAQSYGFTTKNFNRRGLCSVSAWSFEKNSVVLYSNGYYDWNGMPIAFMLNIASEMTKNPEMIQMFKKIIR